MLAASDSAPNTHPLRPISTPVPGNWRGVTDGMTAAKNAIRQNNLEQAEQILLELLEFAPVEIKAWKLLAKVQRHLDHIDEGIKSATRALQLQNNPLSDEPPASITLAKLLWEQHEYHEAKSMLALLVKMQPDNSELNTLLQQWEMESTI